MRIVGVLLILLSFQSCNPGIDGRFGSCPPVDFIRFVVLDKQGRNVIVSKDTSISITYSLGGVTKKSEILISKIFDNSSDSARTLKYSGVCIRSRGIGGPS